MHRRPGLLAVTALTLTLAWGLVGCGSKADPFVGYWQQAGGGGAMLLNVAPQKHGHYPVTWDDGSAAGAVRLDVFKKSAGVYTDGLGDTFTMIGAGEVDVRFTDVYGKHARVTFKKTATSSDDNAWDPD